MQADMQHDPQQCIYDFDSVIVIGDDEVEGAIATFRQYCPELNGTISVR